MKLPRPTRRLLLSAAATTLAATTIAAFTGTPFAVSASSRPGTLLVQNKIILKSAKQVDLHNGTVRLPLHRGEFNGKTVWYILTESSDFGLAADLGVTYAAKLTNPASPAQPAQPPSRP